jgi:transcriptional regulator
MAPIIRTHPLGMLVTQGDAGLDADHVPFEYDPGAGTHGLLTVREHAADMLQARGHGAMASAMRQMA